MISPVGPKCIHMYVVLQVWKIQKNIQYNSNDKNNTVSTGSFAFTI